MTHRSISKPSVVIRISGNDEEQSLLQGGVIGQTVTTLPRLCQGRSVGWSDTMQEALEIVADHDSYIANDTNDMGHNDKRGVISKKIGE